MILKFGTRPEYDDIQWEVFGIEEAWKIIKNHLDTLKLEWRYGRCNFSPEENWFELDFGSHTYFFRGENLSEEDWGKFRGDDSNRIPEQSFGIDISETEYAKNKSK